MVITLCAGSLNIQVIMVCFGISGVSLIEGQSAKIAAAMSEIFPHTQGKSSEYWSWWSRGLDLQGKNRIPRDWGNDGAVWAKLRERDADSILQPPVKRFWPFMKSWIWTYCVNYLIVSRKCLK